jgi:DNA-binding GntR family transcriptional regulator
MRGETDIFEDLRKRLIRGSFAYGSKLRAESLRQDYDCSASTVREALFRLSTLGLVDFQEQRGFRMPERSLERQHDITQMRILLESEGACRSIRQGGVAWEARLTAAHHQLSHIETRMSGKGAVDELPDLWMQAELEFHQTLISASGSDLLRQMHMMVYHQFRQQLIVVDRGFENLADNIAQHRAILEAAIAGDEARVRAAIEAHFARHLVPDMQVRAAS